jgi:hypothetical protein
MSQADIDAFVNSAGWPSTLTPECVATAVTLGIPINGRRSWDACTALHCTVYTGRREVVVALLAAGADANAADNDGETLVSWAAYNSTADILQLLLDGGGSVNKPDDDGETPLVSLVCSNRGDVAARLDVLLAQPELDLDAKYYGKTAKEWAEEEHHFELAAAIAEERRRRARWHGLRSTWISATIAPTTPYSNLPFPCNSEF